MLAGVAASQSEAQHVRQVEQTAQTDLCSPALMRCTHGQQLTAPTKLLSHCKPQRWACAASALCLASSSHGWSFLAWWTWRCPMCPSTTGEPRCVLARTAQPCKARPINRAAIQRAATKNNIQRCMCHGIRPIGRMPAVLLCPPFPPHVLQEVYGRVSAADATFEVSLDMNTSYLGVSFGSQL